MLALREKTKRLTALPAPGYAPQTTITVARAILLKSSAPTNGVAVAAMQQRIAGTTGTQGDLDRVRNRLALTKKGMHAAFGFSKKRFSPESLAARLAPPFILAPAMPDLPPGPKSDETCQIQRRSRRGRGCSPW
jgi:hypothetical protein